MTGCSKHRGGGGGGGTQKNRKLHTTLISQLDLLKVYYITPQYNFKNMQAIFRHVQKTISILKIV